MHILGGVSEQVYKACGMTSMQCDTTQQHMDVYFANKHITLPASQWLQ